MGHGASTLLVPTAGSSTQAELIGVAGAAGLQDLKVRSIGLGTNASGTAGDLSCSRLATFSRQQAACIQINSPDSQNQPFYFSNETVFFPDDLVRPDTVYTLGYNLSPNGHLAQAGEPAIGLQFESYYAAGAGRFCEFHIMYVDPADTQHRIITWQADRLSNTTGIHLGFGSLDLLNIQNAAGNTPFEFDFSGSNLTTPTLLVDSAGINSARILKNTNNASWLQQLNAAGNGTVELVRVDASNKVVVDPGASGITLHGSVTCDSTVSGNTFQAASGDLVVKTVNGGNLINFICGSTSYLQVSSSYVLPGVHVLAGTTNSYDIGSATNAFRDLYLGGKPKRINGIATAGMGVPAIYTTGRATAQTAANASVTTFTPGADGTFEVQANVLITTLGSGSFTVTVAYTDEGGTARTTTLPFTNTAGSTVTTCNAAAPFQGNAIKIRAKASNAITVATTGTFTSCTYNVEASLIQVN